MSTIWQICNFIVIVNLTLAHLESNTFIFVNTLDSFSCPSIQGTSTSGPSLTDIFNVALACPELLCVKTFEYIFSFLSLALQALFKTCAYPDLPAPFSP